MVGGILVRGSARSIAVVHGNGLVEVFDVNRSPFLTTRKGHGAVVVRTCRDD